MKNRKIANGAEYRMDEHFQNFLILGILIIFQITKKIYISKVCNLENSQNFYGKLAIFQIAIIDWKRDQIFEIVQFKKLINSPNSTFWKIKQTLNVTIWKI